MKKILSVSFLLVSLASLSGCDTFPQPQSPTDHPQNNRPPIISQVVDDWQYKYSASESTSFKAPLSTATMMSATAPTGNLGFSVGGSKDIKNFRENIKNKFLPLPTDITYEGLFYNYFFDTGNQQTCDKLFCPSYSTAVSKDPLSGKPEYYLSVGLNSGVKESDFQRKKLNLVVVMDISGSMDSPFNKYYYDHFGNKVELKNEENNQTKMRIATQSVASLLDHLKPDDSFGLVLFDESAYLAKPLSRIATTDLPKLKNHILEITHRGSTNLQAGLKKGTDLLREMSQADPNQYENRIIFITDAMPNTGNTEQQDLAKIFADNSARNINTTFIGVGVDFNTGLVEKLTKIRGANYYSVHSTKEFHQLLDEDFDYMVTPLVFDLKLNLASQGYEIEQVYGSPEADQSTGEIMKVNTLFPSKTENNQTKGGVILLKLNKLSTTEGSPSPKLSLQVSYEDRNGQKFTDEKQINFAEKSTDYFDNSGIEKAILLTRYANLIKDWLIDQIRYFDQPTTLLCPPIVAYDTGIRCIESKCLPPMPPLCEIHLGQWERKSTPLQVDSRYRPFFQDFATHFQSEMKNLNDPTLQQELDILQLLAKF